MENFAFAFGVFAMVARSGPVLNNLLTPIIAQHSIGVAALVGLVFLALSAASSYIFILSEKHASNIENMGSFPQVQLKESFNLRFI